MWIEQQSLQCKVLVDCCSDMVKDCRATFSLPIEKKEKIMSFNIINWLFEEKKTELNLEDKHIKKIKN